MSRLGDTAEESLRVGYSEVGRDIMISRCSSAGDLRRYSLSITTLTLLVKMLSFYTSKSKQVDSNASK